MAMRAFATAVIGLALAGTAQAQRSDRYEVMDDAVITRTLSFAAGGGRTLDVRNINGFIHVEATSDSTVQMSIRKVIRAATQEDLAEARREVQIEFTDNTARVGATVTEANRHVCGQEWEDDEGRQWRRRRYHVKYDFTIRVPRDTALRLCTINGGDVTVTGTRGDFDVDNVNGSIELRNIAGSGQAHTVNGPVSVTLTANPASPTSFKTVNGNVDITFVDGLAAEFSMKTMNGGLYTDFDVTPLAAPVPPAGERRNGRFVYRAHQHTRVRVGSGGPQITFETLNGNVRARRAQGRVQ
jgi:hypothetical protein